jgi:uncharacterized protein (TIRG00374 family)
VKLSFVGRIVGQVGLSLIFIGILLWRVNLDQLWDDLGRTDWRWALLGIPIFAAAALVHGLRWWLILRYTGKVRFSGSVLALYSSKGADLILPFNAGIVAQAQILHRRYGLDRTAVVAAVVAEGVLDAIVIALLAPLALLALPNGDLPLPAAWAFVLPVVAIAVIARTRWGRRLVETLLRLAPAWPQARIRSLANRMRVAFGALGDVRSLLLLMGLTLADWSLQALAYFAIGQPFHLGVSGPTYLLVTVVATLSSAVPLTQANVGPYELVMREVLAAAGADGDRAAAFAVASHAVLIATIIIMAAASAAIMGLRARDLFYLRRAADQSEGETNTPA